MAGATPPRPKWKPCRGDERAAWSRRVMGSLPPPPPLFPFPAIRPACARQTPAAPGFARRGGVTEGGKQFITLEAASGYARTTAPGFASHNRTTSRTAHNFPPADRSRSDRTCLTRRGYLPSLRSVHWPTLIPALHLGVLPHPLAQAPEQIQLRDGEGPSLSGAHSVLQVEVNREILEFFHRPVRELLEAALCLFEIPGAVGDVDQSVAG